MRAKLSLRDVVVRRGAAELLRVAYMDVWEGEVLALMGPNGAGKTTLVQTLGMLERPSQGEVLFEGEPVTGRELELRRRTALVFQESLLLNRSVEGNVALGLSLRKVPRRERKERVARWLDRFGIATLAKRSGRSLSGGEAQRTSLARAFALEPEVLLLDEPFSSLDQPTRESLLDQFADVLQETGVTAVFVSHERDEAARLADRVAVLAEGDLRQIGPVAEVFAAPADETVAAYVGAETLAQEARVTASEDGLVTLDVGGVEIEAIADGFVGSRALVCLRPEDVVLSTRVEQADSARNHLLGVVRRITLTGSAAHVELDCGFTLVAVITKRSLEELGLEVGSRAAASFKATAVHLIPRGRSAGGS